jgi:acyl-CoA carboxylase subunit beta
MSTNILLGLADQLATSELEALKMARSWVQSLTWQKHSKPRLPLSITPPLYPPESLLGVIQSNIRLPFASREIISRLVDGSRFLDFKPLYGPNLVCGWSYLFGKQVGIIANDSVIFPEEANKASQFISLCNARDAPILFLSNITGFMVGREYEEAGIIKAGVCIN